jgi:hypothetical protein
MRKGLAVTVGFAMLLAEKASAEMPEELIQEAPAAAESHLTATAEDVDFTAPWSVEDTPREIQAVETGYEKFHLWKKDDGFVRYITPSGTKAGLQVTACVQDTWCCTGGYEICYYNYSSSADDELQLTLSGAHSIACTLLHDEDDTARKQYFATDSGNDCVSSEKCFKLREEGNQTAPVRAWGGFYIICF